MPVYENDYCTMVFSDYIQESFDEMKAFMNAGVKRFVIDSWMLKETCVKDTLRIYRAYLDGKETEEMVRTYRKTYGELPLSSGYYEQKTVR
jgi:collagenase-like PrtC family protease